MSAAHQHQPTKMNRALHILSRLSKHIPWLTSFRTTGYQANRKGMRIMCSTSFGAQIRIRVVGSERSVLVEENPSLLNYKRGTPHIAIFVNPSRSDLEIANDLYRKLSEKMHEVTQFGIRFWTHWRIDLVIICEVLHAHREKLSTGCALFLAEHLETHPTLPSWYEEARAISLRIDGIIVPLVHIQTRDDSHLFVICTPNPDDVEPLKLLLSTSQFSTSFLVLYVPTPSSKGWRNRLRGKLNELYRSHHTWRRRIETKPTETVTN